MKKPSVDIMKGVHLVEGLTLKDSQLVDPDLFRHNIDIMI